MRRANGRSSTPANGAPATRRARRPRATGASLSAQGEPMLWMTGAALAIALAMIAGLLGLVLVQGLSTFRARPLWEFALRDGTRALGEIARHETYRVRDESGPVAGASAAGAALPRTATRTLVRTGNFDVTGEHFRWIEDADIVSRERPEWAMCVERTAWGRFHGVPLRFETDGAAVTREGLDAPRFAARTAWAEIVRLLPEVDARRDEIARLERHDIGRLNEREERARLAVRRAELSDGADSPAHRAALDRLSKVESEVESETAKLRERIEALRAENARHSVVMGLASGGEKALPLAEIVRVFPANRLDALARAKVFLSRWWEFLTDEPREANSEGGVFPAIFGTLVMTLVMTLAVVPFGVLAALYLHEYARKGWAVTAVRIAINNLAGVPSIVFGVFGLGFFCYIVGGGIDSLFFPERLPSPTFGKGGLLWASLTLALLTLPVVIVATEEALAAVPGSLREGSYACGASKWQTIRRIILPMAAPGVMTGAILAMARGAGEVAPLMLVGAVKLAPDLPADGSFPFLHPERSFMHLGFHIYDLGFQSQNSEAARPMVFTTTLLLVALVAALNLFGVRARARLRARLAQSRF